MNSLFDYFKNNSYINYMKKEKIEKYIEMVLFLGGVVIFGFIAYVAVQFGTAILKAIF